VDLSKLKELAANFRSAIERCDPEKLCPRLRNYPRGSCGDATPLLGTYLIEQGMEPFMYVSGERGDKDDGTWTSHAWLEGDGVIVDITADQFPEISERVVVTTFSPWHGTFEQNKEHIADYRFYAGQAAGTMLENCYRVIIEELHRR
jgi:hypothetical protein